MKIKFTQEQLKEICDKEIARFDKLTYEIWEHHIGVLELYFYTKEHDIEGDNFSLFPNRAEHEEDREEYGAYGYNSVEEFKVELECELSKFNEWNYGEKEIVSLGEWIRLNKTRIENYELETGFTLLTKPSKLAQMDLDINWDNLKEEDYIKFYESELEDYGL